MTSGAASAVVALDIGGTKIASAIGDAGGELRRWRTLPTEAERGAERVLESAIALANEVLCEERASGGDVRAMGVSTMGLTASIASISRPTSQAGRTSRSPR